MSVQLMKFTTEIVAFNYSLRRPEDYSRGDRAVGNEYMCSFSRTLYNHTSKLAIPAVRQLSLRVRLS